MGSLVQATQNVSVRTKMFVGFGLVLSVLFIISFISFTALETQTARFNLVNQVSQANLLVLEAREQEKNFLLRKDPSYYHQAIAMAQQASSAGQAALAQFSTTTSITLMQEMLRHIDTYQQQLHLLFNAEAGTAKAADIEQAVTLAARAADKAGTDSVNNQLNNMQQEEQYIKRVITISTVLAVLISVVAALVITAMVVNPLKEVVIVAQTIAAGDLTHNLPTDRKDEPGQLMQAMQQMTVNLRDLLQNLTLGIAQLATATEEMAAISEENSAGVLQQKQETEQVATAMNEMTATVHDVAKSAEEASSAANSSAEQAQRGEQVVQQTMQQIKNLSHEVALSAHAISELKQQTNDIGTVLDVIKSIADQTNLLALNAAIEAARAGDAGRGFSVVADEVRALAFRTQESTGKIEDLISTLQHKAETSVLNMQKSAALAETTLDTANNVGVAIKTINLAVGNIQQMNLQIAAAAMQQSTVAEQINRSIFSIRDVADQSATASVQTAAASSDLSTLGNELQVIAGRFKMAI